VPNARSGTHHLHIAGLGSALVAEAVFVSDGAFADVGDDLHVGVRMGWEAGVGGNLVVVPHPKGAPAHSGRVHVFSEGKVVPGFQPAMICGGELVEWSAFDHRVSPGMTCFVATGMDRRSN
jgi:hypothetical protein